MGKLALCWRVSWTTEICFICQYSLKTSKILTPAMPTSEEVRTSMNLMRLWAGAVANPSRTLQDWENGLNRRNATPTRVEPIPFNQASPVSSAPMPNSPTRQEIMSNIRISQMLLIEDKVELDVFQDDAFYIINLIRFQCQTRCSKMK